MTAQRPISPASIRGVALAAAIFRSEACGPLVAAALASSALAAPAFAQTADFTPIGSFGEYRLDGVRDAVHEGARVRLVDMTLRNLSGVTTFPETIQAVWWQGRGNGSQVSALRRDLSRFGMYDQMAPGAAVEVSYVIPVRDDIDGIRVDYMHGAAGQKERRWTWEQLLQGAPGVLYSRGRPAEGASGAPAPAPVAPAEAPAAERAPDEAGERAAAPRIPASLRSRVRRGLGRIALPGLLSN